MATDASSAFFSMTQAEYAAGNFKQKVTEGSLTARIRVGAAVENVAGVKLPVFTVYETGAAADNQSLGLVGGGKKIVAVREKFTHFMEQLVKLASLQTSFVTLDEAMKVTNRRVNALENVTIPKIQGILDYISRELDELEREGKKEIICFETGYFECILKLRFFYFCVTDFTRLKPVQGKKEDVVAEKASESKENDNDITAAFDAGDDDDVVF